MRDKDRDISEKIALGMPSNSGTQESMYDQRLFNKSQVSVSFHSLPEFSFSCLFLGSLSS